MVQCALTINLFNEKIFVVVWFWYVCVAVATVFSLAQWLVRSVVWPAQFYFVKKQLRSFDVTHRSKTHLRKFMQYYLRRDGLFVIRLIAINVGELVAAEVLAGLWENYGPDKKFLAENPDTRRRLLRGKASQMDIV